ncbi:MAG: tRNA pseudouridine(38-40) synthase TruA [Thermodesulfobacteriota bacterium]
MRNIKIIIEYDGTNFCGWQKQPGRKTVQQEIETAIVKITREKTIVYGSGRTDSGVHALGQVANFKTNSDLTVNQLQKALNTNLPSDISIIKAKEVPDTFHSQFSSKSKIYLYTILNRDCRSAVIGDRTWQVSQILNLHNMKLASEFLLGTRDFQVFAHSGITVKSTVRTVRNIKLSKKKDIINFEIEADGFLKRMVRLIVGTLVQVGKEKITPKEFKKILDSSQKTKFVISAPPQGLFLKKVKY